MFANNHFILVAAMARNRVIGVDGTIPWHCPADLKWFKGLTQGHAVIMGRETYESLPIKPLPGRLNIVVSRNKDYWEKVSSKTIVVDSLKKAAIAASRAGITRQYVVGGAQLYTEALPYCTDAYISEVDIAVPKKGKDVAVMPPLPENEICTTIVLQRPLPEKQVPLVLVHHRIFSGKIKSVFD